MERPLYWERENGRCYDQQNKSYTNKNNSLTFITTFDDLFAIQK